MKLVHRFRNLLGIPSYHYEPLFAQTVRRVVRRFRPTAIALELPACVQSELAWAASCWPAPVAVLAAAEPGDGTAEFIPFVPGDSIVEAYRQATLHRLATFFVDLDAVVRRQPALAGLPGAEFAPRVGQLFLETNDALDAAAGPPAAGDRAREAFMARHLAELMQTHRHVLWVGGLAHWTRIVQRIAREDFEAPAAIVRGARTFRRMRLAPSALMRMTQRLPYLVSGYASAPDVYDEAQALRTMALAAAAAQGPETTDAGYRREPVLAVDPAQGEAATPIDIVRMLLYARNLAAGNRLSERPGFDELLRAAAATVDNRYAARLYAIAMQERTSAAAQALAPLTYEVIGTQQGFRWRGEWITAEPYWPVPGGLQLWVPSPDEVARRAEGRPYTRVPSAQSHEDHAWACYPPDEIAYEAFVHYVLRHAGARDPAETRSQPFLTGLRDGLDVRATIRHWHEQRPYVREECRRPLNVTNGIIDFTSDSEQSPLLRGLPVNGQPSGWVDPSCLHVGSASREFRYDVLQEEPCHVSLRQRGLSLITLDAPTWIKGDDSKGFHARVIQHLVTLSPADDNLYGWLDVMFAFCHGKPAAYYSRYVPSARVHQIARAHKVQVIYCPLQQIPRPLLERNRCFRFLWLTRRQWDALLEGIAEGKIAWLPPDAVARIALAP